MNQHLERRGCFSAASCEVVRISQGSKNVGFRCRAEPIIRTLMPLFARYSV